MKEIKSRKQFDFGTHHSRMIKATSAIDEDVTFSHGGVVRQHFECGRFTSTVDAEQSEAFALLDSKINATNNIWIIISFVQIRHDHRIFIKFIIWYAIGYAAAKIISHQFSGQRPLFLHLSVTVRWGTIQLDVIAGFRFWFLCLLSSARSECEQTSKFLSTIDAFNNIDQYQLKDYEIEIFVLNSVLASLQWVCVEKLKFWNWRFQSKGYYFLILWLKLNFKYF